MVYIFCNYIAFYKCEIFSKNFNNVKKKIQRVKIKIKSKFQWNQIFFITLFENILQKEVNLSVLLLLI